MFLESLPLIYSHPSLVVAVDDNASFLDSLRYQLDNRRLVKTFTDPDEAHDWIRRSCAENPPYSPSLRSTCDDLTFAIDERSVRFDASSIASQVYDVKRFLRPSLIVADYSMPTQTGLQLLEALADLPMIRVLLTGVADERLAVDAFNRGMLDGYLCKSNAITGTLNGDLADLQKRYFSRRLRELHQLLCPDSSNFLFDPAIAQLIGWIMVHHGFVEHYWYSNPQGFLFVTGAGDTALLVIETEAGMAAQAEAAKDYSAPPRLIEALERRAVVPWFWPGEGMYTPACSEWQPYCLPAETYYGHKKYYYALFNTPDCLLKTEIVGFERVREQYDQA